MTALYHIRLMDSYKYVRDLLIVYLSCVMPLEVLSASTHRNAFTQDISQSVPTRLLILGDDLADDNNAFGLNATGYVFTNSLYQASFSNGPTIATYLGMDLGLNCPWYNRDTVGISCVDYTNIARGYSCIGNHSVDVSGFNCSSYNLPDQVNLVRSQLINSSTIVVLIIGGQDLQHMAAIIQYPNSTIHLNNALQVMLDSWLSAIQNLYAMGVRNIVYVTPLPWELTPLGAATLATLPLTQQTQLVQRLDSVVDMLVDTLNNAARDYGDLVVTIADVDSCISSVLSGDDAGISSVSSAITVTNQPCITGSSTCTNVNNYFWLDATHPTTLVQKFIGDGVFAKLTGTDTCFDYSALSSNVVFTAHASGFSKIQVIADDANTATNGASFANYVSLLFNGSTLGVKADINSCFFPSGSCTMNFSLPDPPVNPTTELVIIMFHNDLQQVLSLTTNVGATARVWAANYILPGLMELILATVDLGFQYIAVVLPPNPLSEPGVASTAELQQFFLDFNHDVHAMLNSLRYFIAENTTLYVESWSDCLEQLNAGAWGGYFGAVRQFQDYDFFNFTAKHALECTVNETAYAVNTVTQCQSVSTCDAHQITYLWYTNEYLTSAYLYYMAWSLYTYILTGQPDCGALMSTTIAPYVMLQNVIDVAVFTNDLIGEYVGLVVPGFFTPTQLLTRRTLLWTNSGLLEFYVNDKLEVFAQPTRLTIPVEAFEGGVVIATNDGYYLGFVDYAFVLTGSITIPTTSFVLGMSSQGQPWRNYRLQFPLDLTFDASMGATVVVQRNTNIIPSTAVFRDHSGLSSTFSSTGGSLFTFQNYGDFVTARGNGVLYLSAVLLLAGNTASPLGWFSLTLNTFNGDAWYTLVLNNVTGTVISAQLLRAIGGVTGSSGAFSISLSVTSVPTVINIIQLTSRATLPAEIRSSPTSFYVQLDTSVYPSGQIRGQLTNSRVTPDNQLEVMTLQFIDSTSTTQARVLVLKNVITNDATFHIQSQSYAFTTLSLSVDQGGNISTVLSLPIGGTTAFVHGSVPTLPAINILSLTFTAVLTPPAGAAIALTATPTFVPFLRVLKSTATGSEAIPMQSNSFTLSASFDVDATNSILWWRIKTDITGVAVTQIALYPGLPGQIGITPLVVLANGLTGSFMIQSTALPSSALAALINTPSAVYLSVSISGTAEYMRGQLYPVFGTDAYNADILYQGQSYNVRVLQDNLIDAVSVQSLVPSLIPISAFTLTLETSSGILFTFTTSNGFQGFAVQPDFKLNYSNMILRLASSGGNSVSSLYPIALSYTTPHDLPEATHYRAVLSPMSVVPRTNNGQGSGWVEVSIDSVDIPRTYVYIDAEFTLPPLGAITSIVIGYGAPGTVGTTLTTIASGFAFPPVGSAANVSMNGFFGHAYQVLRGSSILGRLQGTIEIDNLQFPLFIQVNAGIYTVRGNLSPSQSPRIAGTGLLQVLIDSIIASDTAIGNLGYPVNTPFFRGNQQLLWLPSTPIATVIWYPHRYAVEILLYPIPTSSPVLQITVGTDLDAIVLTPFDTFTVVDSMGSNALKIVIDLTAYQFDLDFFAFASSNFPPIYITTGTSSTNTTWVIRDLAIMTNSYTFVESFVVLDCNCSSSAKVVLRLDTLAGSLIAHNVFINLHNITINGVTFTSGSSNGTLILAYTPSTGPLSVLTDISFSFLQALVLGLDIWININAPIPLIGQMSLLPRVDPEDEIWIDIPNVQLPATCTGLNRQVNVRRRITVDFVGAPDGTDAVVVFMGYQNTTVVGTEILGVLSSSSSIGVYTTGWNSNWPNSLSMQYGAALVAGEILSLMFCFSPFQQVCTITPFPVSSTVQYVAGYETFYGTSAVGVDVTTSSAIVPSSTSRSDQVALELQALASLNCNSDPQSCLNALQLYFEAIRLTAIADTNSTFNNLICSLSQSVTSPIVGYQILQALLNGLSDPQIAIPVLTTDAACAQTLINVVLTASNSTFLQVARGVIASFVNVIYQRVLGEFVITTIVDITDIFALMLMTNVFLISSNGIPSIGTVATYSSTCFSFSQVNSVVAIQSSYYSSFVDFAQAIVNNQPNGTLGMSIATWNAGCNPFQNQLLNLTANISGIISSQAMAFLVVAAQIMNGEIVEALNTTFSNVKFVLNPTPTQQCIAINGAQIDPIPQDGIYCIAPLISSTTIVTVIDIITVIVVEEYPPNPVIVHAPSPRTPLSPATPRLAPLPPPMQNGTTVVATTGATPILPIESSSSGDSSLALGLGLGLGLGIPLLLLLLAVPLWFLCFKPVAAVFAEPMPVAVPFAMATTVPAGFTDIVEEFDSVAPVPVAIPFEAHQAFSTVHTDIVPHAEPFDFHQAFDTVENVATNVPPTTPMDV